MCSIIIRQSLLTAGCHQPKFAGDSWLSPANFCWWQPAVSSHFLIIMGLLFSFSEAKKEIIKTKQVSTLQAHNLKQCINTGTSKKCSLNGKQCIHWSDFSFWSSLSLLAFFCRGNTQQYPECPFLSTPSEVYSYTLDISFFYWQIFFHWEK